MYGARAGVSLEELGRKDAYPSGPTLPDIPGSEPETPWAVAYGSKNRRKRNGARRGMLVGKVILEKLISN